MLTPEHFELIEFVSQFRYGNASEYDCFDYFVGRGLMPEDVMWKILEECVESGAIRKIFDVEDGVCFKLNSPVDIVRKKRDA